MRQGQQHRRGRGRSSNNNSSNNHNNNGGGGQQHQRKGQNPLSKRFESNGPEGRVSGTAALVAEKYLQLARDAQSSGDPVLAENYLQHSEHYNRMIMAYREQQGLPSPPASENGNGQMRSRFDGPDTDDNADDAASDDFGQAEQPMVQRFPQEPQRGPEATRSDDRPQRQHDGQHQQNQQNSESGQGRFRDRQDRQRNRNDRVDNRGDRGERSDRSDRSEHRGERYDNRPERIDRGDRSERFERPADRGFDRPQGERPAERHLERHGEERGPEPRFEAPRQSEPRPVESRIAEPRSVEPRLEPRLPRERPADAHPVPAAVDDTVAPPVRAEAAPGRARRERFGPGNEQPDFLRRPVRRPRREAEPAASPLPPTVSEEPPRD